MHTNSEISKRIDNKLHGLRMVIVLFIFTFITLFLSDFVGYFVNNNYFSIGSTLTNFVIALIMSILMSIIIGYTRLIRVFMNKRTNKDSYIPMMLINCIAYIFVLIMLSIATYKPTTDSGFIILIIPFFFINAFWVLPLIGLIYAFFADFYKKN